MLYRRDNQTVAASERARSPQARYIVWRWLLGRLDRYSAYGPAVVSVLTAFLVTRLVIFGVIAASLVTVRVDQGLPMPRNAPPLLAGLLRWDSQHYAYIAQYGYDRLHTAFFPLYPLLVKGLSVLVGNVFVAGVLVSHVALLVALGYLYALTRRMRGDAAARRATFYLAGAPAAVFFSAMYTEGLFVALTAATLYHARRGQWVRAACAGGLAAATRNTGVILTTVLVLEALRQGGVRLQRPAWGAHAWRVRFRAQWRCVRAASPGLAAAAVVPGGLLVYMLYLAYAFGDPLAFVHVEASWHRYFALSNMLRLIPGSLTVATVIDVGVTAAFVPLVIVVAYRMRATAIFTVLSFALPLSTGLGVDGMTRYTLMLVPCFVLLGSWGERIWVHRVVMACSFFLMVYVSVLFSHWSGPV